MFFNTKTKQFNTGKELEYNQKLFEQVSNSNFEFNTLRGVLKREEWKPVLGSWFFVYPEMIVDEKQGVITDPVFTPSIINTPNLQTFLDAALTFFEQFKDKQIGVQLSGGLDSSLIIGLLKYFNIPFHLVGMTNERYEFRTESYIQNLLASWGDKVVLLDFESYLPLSQINQVPFHPYPDLSVNNFASDNAMATVSNELGIEVLLTGEGGDNLFAEAISHNVEDCTWKPQVFGDYWNTKHVYAPKEVELVSFYADKGIMNAVFNLRKGHAEDNNKIWARQYFKDFLPKELVDFTYCADFWGLYVDGLLNTIPTIKELFKNAITVTNNKAFSKSEFDRLFGQDLLEAKKEMYQQIEARVALSVWINSATNKISK